MSRLHALRRAALTGACLLAIGAAPAPAADLGTNGAAVPELEWGPCGVPGREAYQCATAEVPLSYREPAGQSVELVLARLPATDQARKIGTLFWNPGGPGGSGRFPRAFSPALRERFDLVGFDPRGVQGSMGVRCFESNEQAIRLFGQEFPITLAQEQDFIRRVSRGTELCARNAGPLLSHMSTANVARDLDLLRDAVGDEQLTYLGFSYGTFLGATYASLFPHRYRALVLDGALDPDQYINRPLENLREQSAGFERAFDRFFQACAAQQDVCQFGGKDPWTAFDELVDQANRQPLPATGPDPRPVDGGDILAAANLVIYNKGNWGALALALQRAAAGDGTLLRVIADAFYGRNEDGTYSPGTDRYFTLSALEQRYRSDVETYLKAGAHSWGLFDHFWYNAGYVELNWGLFPVRPRGVYRGPFRASRSASTTLVVGTTYDPATPYRGSKRMVTQLGNARLLTMRGDGHTAYGGNSACIDAAVDAYLEDGTLPAEGTTCRQEVPFELPEVQAQSAPVAMQRALRGVAPHVKPLSP